MSDEIKELNKEILNKINEEVFDEKIKSFIKKALKEEYEVRDKKRPQMRKIYKKLVIDTMEG
ncbi:MAG: hypothetical protein Q4Q19_03965 [Methanobrevibacter sp.]|nr:hypothetical protein [Methanobrevibacter sp.]